MAAGGASVPLQGAAHAIGRQRVDIILIKIPKIRNLAHPGPYPGRAGTFSRIGPREGPTAKPKWHAVLTPRSGRIGRDRHLGIVPHTKFCKTVSPPCQVCDGHHGSIRTRLSVNRTGVRSGRVRNKLAHPANQHRDATGKSSLAAQCRQSTTSATRDSLSRGFGRVLLRGDLKRRTFAAMRPPPTRRDQPDHPSQVG